MPNIELALVICNEGEDCRKIVGSVLKCGMSPICCSKLEEARKLLAQDIFRVVFCQDSLVDGDFRAVLRAVKNTSPRTPVIVLSRVADWDSYLKALSLGVFDYIVCPANHAEAQRIIWLALADTMDYEKAAYAAV